MNRAFLIGGGTAVASGFFLASRVLLAAIFAMAGLSKLAAFAQSREGLVSFGIAPRFAGGAAAVLIILELAVAASLIPAASAWYGAIGAAALLGVFSAAIATNLLQHRRPNCNCFGQFGSAPIGWPTFARNVALFAIAASVVSRGRDQAAFDLIGWTYSSSATEAIAFILALGILVMLVALVALLVQVLRQQGRMLLRFEALEQHLGIGRESGASAQLPGLVPGTAAPAFELKELEGEATSLERLLQLQKTTLLVFSDPNCGPCQALLPEIAGWQRDLADQLTIAMISEGSPETNRAKFASRGIARVLLQNEREVAELYQAYGTPAAVAIAADGRIASFVAQGGDAIGALVRAIRSRELPRLPVPAVQIGEPAPELSFKTNANEEFALADLRGTPALLLFWDQACGFCQRMLSELQTWEAEAPANAPRLLVVSSGSAEDNRSLTLRSTIVLDEGSRAAQAFGAQGTPMAVLLDRDGRVASEVVAGAQAIFALAGRGVPAAKNGRVAATAG